MEFYASPTYGHLPQFVFSRNYDRFPDAQASKWVDATAEKMFDASSTFNSTKPERFRSPPTSWWPLQGIHLTFAHSFQNQANFRASSIILDRQTRPARRRLPLSSMQPRSSMRLDGTHAIDVHGAGCQRSDPKTGDPDDYPSLGNGPQGDVQRVFNFVRLVRDTGTVEDENTAPTADAGGPYSADVGETITLDASGSNDTDGSIALYQWDLDNDGTVVHSWTSDFAPGLSTYLLEDGSLMRTASLQGPDQDFIAGGAGGRMEQWSWDGELLWEFEYSSSSYQLHHDIEVLPNRNVFMIAWEVVSEEDALAAGRDSSLVNQGELWPDHIVEVEPTGSSGGNIVWEWHAWDHLVQDHDSTKENFGVVADHPELIDVNFESGQLNAGWTHINSIDYNADLDQILLSVHGFSEVWVIDHSTTTEEAAGHSGGDSGAGGDLLYRQGGTDDFSAERSPSPATYSEDRQCCFATRGFQEPSLPDPRPRPINAPQPSVPSPISSLIPFPPFPCPRPPSLSSY